MHIDITEIISKIRGRFKYYIYSYTDKTFPFLFFILYIYPLHVPLLLVVKFIAFLNFQNFHKVFNSRLFLLITNSSIYIIYFPKYSSSKISSSNLSFLLHNLRSRFLIYNTLIRPKHIKIMFHTSPLSSLIRKFNFLHIIHLRCRRSKFSQVRRNLITNCIVNRYRLHA